MEVNVAVVGATGLVGAEALSILASRAVEPDRIIALASARSDGAVIDYAGEPLPVIGATRDALDGADLVLLCASADAARDLAPAALDAGAVVIDNSSAFRLDPQVPLVVPEINGDGLGAQTTLIANPNCSTIILLLALDPLRRAFGIEHIDVSTYQAVSGAGAGAIADLEQQARAFAAGEPIEPRFFREPCLFNVFSHDAPVDPETGLNGEESKIIHESRRIWSDAALRISPTCVRVPTLRAHAQSIRVRLERPAAEAEVRAALLAAPGLRILDDRARNDFPTPLKASGGDEVLVGRIRPDPAHDGAPGDRFKCFQLFVCADQLRKGAALNAIQIAERLSHVRAQAPTFVHRAGS